MRCRSVRPPKPGACQISLVTQSGNCRRVVREEVEIGLKTGPIRLCARHADHVRATLKIDPTEPVRREMVAEINSHPGERAALEAQHGQVWDTTELGRDFEATGFMAPFVVVRRKADGVKGTLEFQHMPRFYYSFHEDK